MRTLFAAFCSCLLLAACNSQPFVQDAKLDESSSATLVVYTPDTEFNRQNFIKPMIYVDSLELGKVAIDAPLNARLSPGKHAIGFQRAFPIEAATIEIDMQKGEVYYIRYSLDFDDLVQPNNEPKTMGSSSFRLVAKSRGENKE
jgi:hypothetical protein